jgi:hypothetical protein
MVSFSKDNYFVRNNENLSCSRNEYENDQAISLRMHWAIQAVTMTALAWWGNLFGRGNLYGTTLAIPRYAPGPKLPGAVYYCSPLLSITKLKYERNAVYQVIKLSIMTFKNLRFRN